ncbi:DUF6708 domain-containing protein, partial [Chimaeribacter arupi]|uniref:DUF6708 domain-containing protein n=2 Tax=Yersiniaceae TaxID=1903411 RepID=UPI00294788BB
MNYSGLYSPFKVNRPLSEEEIKNQLRQDYTGMGKADSLALDDTIVIRMNSTYLELVDKYYTDRGMPDFFAFIFVMIYFVADVFVIYLLIKELLEPVPLIKMIFLFIFSFPVIMAMGILFYRPLRKSWFTWTHYPVRFNRKSKMVHVFKVDGTIISVPWKEVFFTRGRAGPGVMPEWSIDGHILAEDRNTVIDTFSLGFSNTRQELITNWAFVR